jgi:hypothetical protein
MTLLAALGSAFTSITLLTTALVMLSVWFVITRRRSRFVYVSVVVVVVFSMVATPLLTAQRVTAYSERQLERQVVHEAKPADVAAAQAWQEKLATVQNDPHTDPLALAQARAVAEA